jgi:cytochrome bd-type quinol oxidase subunit 2
MIQTLLVTFLLALMARPIAIAYHRSHYRKKQIITIFAGSFVLSMVLIMIPATNDIGGWLWLVGWLIALILSFTKSKAAKSVKL